MSDPVTLAFRETGAKRFSRQFSEGRSRHLEFLDRLAPGARVLEAGCGGPMARCAIGVC